MVTEVPLELLVAHTWLQGYHRSRRWLTHGHRGTIRTTGGLTHDHRRTIGATGDSRMVVEVPLEPLVAQVLSQGYHCSHRRIMHGHRGTIGATGGSHMVTGVSSEPPVAHTWS